MSCLGHVPCVDRSIEGIPLNPFSIASQTLWHVEQHPRSFGFSPSRFQPDVQVSRYRLADLEKVLNSDHSGDGQADFFDLYRRIFQGHDSLSFRRYLGLARAYRLARQELETNPSAYHITPSYLREHDLQFSTTVSLLVGVFRYLDPDPIGGSSNEGERSRSSSFLGSSISLISRELNDPSNRPALERSAAMFRLGQTLSESGRLRSP